MKKNIVIIVLSVVALLLAGTVGYFIAEKVLSNKYENSDTDKTNKEDNIKELELNSFLVDSLIYPMNNTYNLGYKDYWIYKNETIETLGRSKMMHNAAFDAYAMTNANYKVYYGAEIKSNFIKIYGPDVDYYDGDVESRTCGQISKYDPASNTYTANTGCGGASSSWIDAVTKKYKAEQVGDYIYVYEYVQSVFITPENKNDWQSPMVVYLTDRDVTWEDNPLENKDTKYSVLAGADESNYESIIEQMMDKGEVDTYKWTFKKQSDGKYYFYSGAWEN